jgi:histidine triad (HIT) family protein
LSVDCVFCRIVAGDAPSHRVHEDALTLAFLDLFPVSRGHLLIIPKRHYSDLFGADDASLERVIASSRRLAHALARALEPDGIGVHQLNGSAAGQTIFHYHMHLIPRRAGDPILIHGRKEAPAQELAEVARRIRAALADVP